VKVLLIKDVKSLGKAGEIKEVKDGYGKNFLVGKGFALHATDEVIAEYEAKQAELKKIEAEEIAAAKDKIGANGHLIGSVTNKEISESLNEEFGIDIDKKNISLKNKIKSAGIFEVDCKLGHGIHADLKVDVIGVE
jgi:large subunit ribosomal protein L9